MDAGRVYIGDFCCVGQNCNLSAWLWAFQARANCPLFASYIYLRLRQPLDAFGVLPKGRDMGQNALVSRLDEIGYFDFLGLGFGLLIFVNLNAHNIGFIHADGGEGLSVVVFV